MSLAAVLLGASPATAWVRWGEGGASYTRFAGLSPGGLLIVTAWDESAPYNYMAWGGSAAYDPADGSQVWTATTKFWDVTTTAAGDVVGSEVLPVFPSHVTQLDGSTGSEIWSVAVPTYCSYGRVDVTSADDVVVGSPCSSYTVPLWLGKLDAATGSELWAVEPSGVGDNVRNLVVDALDDVIVLTAEPVTVLKLDGATGAETWRTEMTGWQGVGASEVNVDASGNVFVVGLDDSVRMTVARLDGVTGGIDWAVALPPSAAKFGVGNFTIAVGTSVVAGGVGGDQAMVVSLDPTTGAQQWQWTKAGTDPSTKLTRGAVHDLVIDASGDVFVVGRLKNQKTWNDMLVAKIDGATGTELWSRQFAGPTDSWDEGRSIGLAPDGAPVAVGEVGGAVVMKLRSSDGASFEGTPCGAITCEPCEVCVAPDTCAAQPRSDCQLPLDEQGSFLKVQTDATGNDKLKWRWGKSAGIDDAAFGEPDHGTDYAVCVYDDVAATPRLLWTRALPGLGACAKRPCWIKAGKSGPAEFSYVEKDVTVTPKLKLATKLRAGPPNRARLLLKGKGPLGLPALGLAPPVRVELRSSLGECWGATYADGVLVNDATQFRAKGGP